MLNIQEELTAIKSEREKRFISITELLDFLKEENPNDSYQDIAQYLLIKLRDYNPDCVDDSLMMFKRHRQQWIRENGIISFYVPNGLDEPVRETGDNDFFKGLKSVADSLIQSDDGHTDMALYYLSYDENISVERKRIEQLLNIELSNQDNVRNEEIHHSDENNTEENLALQETIEQQRQEIEQLKNELEQAKQQQEESTKGRITQPQKALIALLIHKNYSDYPSINRIAEVISTELAEIGYTGGISYNTLNGYLEDTKHLNYNKPNKQK